VTWQVQKKGKILAISSPEARRHEVGKFRQSREEGG
jgi:hypothetical protein